MSKFRLHSIAAMMPLAASSRAVAMAAPRTPMIRTRGTNSSSELIDTQNVSFKNSAS